jgi:hypothetical protein
MDAAFLGQGRLQLIATVAGDDRQLLDPGSDKARDGVADERFTRNLHEGLGQGGGEVAKAMAETGCKHNGAFHTPPDLTNSIRLILRGRKGGRSI